MKNKKRKKVTKISFKRMKEAMKLLPHITDEDIKLLQEKGLVSGGDPVMDWDLQAWKELIKNMKLSASHGSMGGQSIGAMKQAGVTQKKMNEILKKHSRIMDGKKMTPEFMRDYFYEIQQELDYWTGDKIDPQSIFSAPNNFFDNPNRKTKPKWRKYPEKFNKFECEAMSPERIDNDGGYTPDNTVITTRGINRMRACMDHDTFLLSLDRQGMKINPNLKPLLEKLKKENKE